MNKKNIRRAFLLAVFLGVQTFALPSVTTAQTVQSIRGTDAAGADLMEPGLYKVVPDRDPYKRDFVQQPPLVPHKVEGYEVSLNFNRCMDCHSWSRYKMAGATKVSLTHFKDRDGGELSNISPRRYFCLQCHVPQTDAPELVDNKFQSAGSLR